MQRHFQSQRDPVAGMNELNAQATGCVVFDWNLVHGVELFRDSCLDPVGVPEWVQKM